MSDLAECISDLEGAVDFIDESAPSDALLTIAANVARAKKAVAAADAKVHEVMTAWIKANGPIVSEDDTRLEIGTKETVICLDRFLVADRLLELKTGDLQGLVDCLAEQPFDIAACRRLMNPAEIKALFTIDSKEVVQVNKQDSAPARGAGRRAS